jgi:hypothetical protein
MVIENVCDWFRSFFRGGCEMSEMKEYSVKAKQKDGICSFVCRRKRESKVSQEKKKGLTGGE